MRTIVWNWLVQAGVAYTDEQREYALMMAASAMVLWHMDRSLHIHD